MDSFFSPVLDQAVSVMGIQGIAMTLKILVIFLALVHVAPIMVWVERRGSAYLQNRLGPNRVGPLGLLQSLADAMKFIFKEDAIPGHVNKFFYFLAPIVTIIPAFMTFAVIPFASSISIGGEVVYFQLAKLDIGLLYIFSIASLGVYGIIMAGWASNSKYAVFGSLRSTAQMISYELSLGLSAVSILMVYSSLDLGTIAAKQGEILWDLGFLQIPKWGIFLFPVGPISFLTFITAAYAETNRLPFDLPEGESEIVAGYHLEYGALKFAIFMMAEFVNMITASGLLTTLFFGGYQLFFPLTWVFSLAQAQGLQGYSLDILRITLEVSSFSIKLGFFMWLFVWVRWTLPRFRYDQLMDIGWKVMLPLALANIFLTAAMIAWGIF